MGDESLGHVPKGARWEFDDEVTRVFDDMLERSIPQHQQMRAAVSRLALSFSPRSVVDLGCSRGAALAALHAVGCSARMYGLEISGPMVASARESVGKFAEIVEHDLRSPGIPFGPHCVALSILTLQFVPIEHRLRVVRDVRLALRSGGALIVVEKILGSTAEMNERFVDLYLESKRIAGYSQEDIDRKKNSLEGVLVPVTARWNEELLRSGGFVDVECFWRWMNFCGWIGIAP